MKHRTLKITIAAVIWTAAAALAITGTIVADTRLMHWALLAALVACAVTENVITETVIQNERLRVEDLLDGLVAEASERAANAAVDRIH